MKKEKIVSILKKKGYIDERELLAIGYTNRYTPTVESNVVISVFLFIIGLLLGWIVIIGAKRKSGKKSQCLIASLNQDKMCIILSALNGKPRFLMREYNIEDIIVDNINFQKDHFQIKVKDKPNVKFDFYITRYYFDFSINFFKELMITNGGIVEANEPNYNIQSLRGIFKDID